MSLRQWKRIAGQSLMAVAAYWTYSLFIIGAIGLGIASLTLILACMRGAEIRAGELAAKFGPTSINVIGGNLVEQAVALRPMTLTWADMRMIRDTLPGVERVSELLTRNNVQVRGGQNRHTADTLAGTGAHHGLSWGWFPALGRDFSEEDIDQARNVCLLGTSTAEKLFGSANPLGEVVLVNDIPLTVVGVLTRQGLSSGEGDFDDRVTVPISTMIRRFNLSRQYLTQLRVSFPSTYGPEKIETAREQLRLLLRRSHHLAPHATDDFLSVTMNDIMQFVNVVKGGIVIFLGSVAAVAVLAGGVAQANLFRLSIAERNMEIGLKKALGANHKAIFSQFLLEALILGAGGAVFGLLLGGGCALLLNSFSILPISLSPGIFVAALGLAGCIAGAFSLRPARLAAELSPVTALKGAA
ncbi:MAG: ABC transporter permease [Candidatus Adiutrix sp.]|jgi:putative ABC transport system permease protein|nr:ABC transporter permease [Candidatus Adiutrix sp.]